MSRTILIVAGVGIASVILLSGLLAVAFTFAMTRTPSVVGKWERTAGVPGTPMAFWQFKSDGTGVMVNEIPDFRVQGKSIDINFKWRIEADSKTFLVIEPIDALLSFKHHYQCTIEGKTMTLIIDGKSTTFRRID